MADFPPDSFFTSFAIIFTIFTDHLTDTTRIPSPPSLTTSSLCGHITVSYTMNGPMTSLHTRKATAKKRSFAEPMGPSFNFISRRMSLRCKLGLLTSMRNRHPTSSAPDLPFSRPEARPAMVKRWCTTDSISPTMAQ